MIEWFIFLWKKNKQLAIENALTLFVVVVVVVVVLLLLFVCYNVTIYNNMLKVLLSKRS